MAERIRAGPEQDAGQEFVAIIVRSEAFVVVSERRSQLIRSA